MAEDSKNGARPAQGGPTVTRRRMLKGLGQGAAAAGLAATGVIGITAATAERLFAADPPSDRFGRMFPNLPPFAEPSPALAEALLDIGKRGGILDAKDDLAVGPVRLIVDPAVNGNNPPTNRDNPTHTAGTTFVGQFIDHDLTFDRGSTLGVPTAPEASTNTRTPRFDIDSMYGGGPAVSPQLYASEQRKFRLESGGRFEDLLRDSNLRAMIPDPRNDEHMILSGLHAAFQLFHNQCVDLVAREAGGSADTFAAARRLVQWHYQWIVLHEFLPQIVGQPLVSEVLAPNGRKFFRPTAPTMPVEFQGAAYRFGHSMVRPSYRANFTGVNSGPFFGLIFNADAPRTNDPDDLVGGARAPRRFVGWPTFFNFGNVLPDGTNPVRPNKRIDTDLSSPLFNLPIHAIATGDLPTVLPQRNLLRQVTWSLPSGQDIAKAMGVPALNRNDLNELRGYGLDLDRSTPLWYYVLKEAEVMSDGLRLGPVGGRIVAEVFIGLMQLDPDSYLTVQPGWTPTLPQRSGTVTGDFRMVDLLTFAGVAGVR